MLPVFVEELKRKIEFIKIAVGTGWDVYNTIMGKN